MLKTVCMVVVQFSLILLLYWVVYQVFKTETSIVGKAILIILVCELSDLVKSFVKRLFEGGAA